MRLAIMQPYFFPYIGYFQLIYSADKFVIYDDVNYIKQGWINRNRLLVNGGPFYFTIPLSKPSSFKKIRNTEIDSHNYQHWRKTFLKTLEQTYKKAPYWDETFLILRAVLNSEHKLITDLIKTSLFCITDYLQINTSIVPSSDIYNNADLNGSQRVIDICRKEKATSYINPRGGLELYNKTDFEREGISLFFLRPKAIEYKQFANAFVPWLSIIDVMMFNPKDKIREFLTEYDLI